MATTIPSSALVPTAPVFTNTERLALAGFLAGYSGLTRQAYELDLRQFTSWCQQHQLRLFQARRADIEFFARDLEARGRARATITRRLCTVAGFYRYAVEEELLDHSPAAHVRRPRLDYESQPPAWTAMSLVRSWSPRGLARGGACADLAARAERAAGLRGHRRGYRRARYRTRPPHSGDHPQGRQGGHYPARTAHHPGLDLAIGERTKGRSSSLRTGSGWTGMEPGGSSGG